MNNVLGSISTNLIKLFDNIMEVEAYTIKNEYELLALSFNGEKPYFSENAKEMKISSKDLTIYYSLQCPYIPNCIEQVQEYCNRNNIPLNLIAIDTLEKAKQSLKKYKTSICQMSDYGNSKYYHVTEYYIQKLGEIDILECSEMKI